MKETLYSESWHVVSELKVSLLYSINIHKQYYRGTTWYVLNDKYSNKFFKVTPEAYKFLSKLTTKKTVEDIWEEYIKTNPDIAPTQDEIVNLLSQLHGNNLLYFKHRADSENMFDRIVKNKNKEIRGKLASFLFIKIPLWNPNDWLIRIKPFIDVFFSKTLLLIWLVFFIYALKLIAENFDSFFDQTQGVLAADNIVFLYISLVILKVFHELGHVMMVKKFGGNVTTVGLMFIVFTPLPFMDASSSWAFTNKYKRALVGAAGMMVELFIAFICVIIWVNTGEGALNSIAFNIMIIGSVSSLVFNGNPLLKFDSYYILSDLLEIPNLYQRAREQCFFWVKKYLFKLKDIYPPTNSKKESFWLALYAILSLIYKFMVAILIAIFVADQWFLFGLIVISISIFIWIIKPLYSFIKYLLHDNELRGKRFNAVTISLLFTLSLIILIGFIPIKDSIRASGIVQPISLLNIYSFSDGLVTEIYIDNVKKVKKGDLILKLENESLNFDLERTRAMIIETKALRLKASQENIANLKPIEKRLVLLDEKLKFLKEKKENLIIKAPKDGLFVSNNIEKLKNRIIKRREYIGKIIDNDNAQFIAAVPQEKASELFNSELFTSEIKLTGIAAKTISVENLTVIPHEQNTLPSAVLGFRGGGDIPILENDEKGTKSKESFFKVIAKIKRDKKNPLLYEDRSGVLRIETTPKTIFAQTVKFVRQLLQKRYQL
ncbi:MAG: site-2 protease family protein [Halarcobacter sp.]